MNLLRIIVSVAFLMSGFVFAKTTTTTPTPAQTKKIQAKVLAACTKEYPKETKGKAFNDVFAWVETEERGENKETFKKTKCFAAHEEWENLTETKEKDEETEHHE